MGAAFGGLDIGTIIEIILLMVAIIGSHYTLKNEVNIVRNDLSNHKDNHAKLELRVTEHENKIDDKLETLSDKMDALKDLIIERTK